MKEKMLPKKNVFCNFPFSYQIMKTFMSLPCKQIYRLSRLSSGKLPVRLPTQTSSSDTSTINDPKYFINFKLPLFLLLESQRTVETAFFYLFFINCFVSSQISLEYPFVGNLMKRQGLERLIIRTFSHFPGERFDNSTYTSSTGTYFGFQLYDFHWDAWKVYFYSYILMFLDDLMYVKISTYSYRLLTEML